MFSFYFFLTQKKSILPVCVYAQCIVYAFICMLLRSLQPVFVRGDKCLRESDTVAERSWEGEGVQ